MGVSYCFKNSLKAKVGLERLVLAQPLRFKILILEKNDVKAALDLDDFPTNKYGTVDASEIPRAPADR